MNDFFLFSLQTTFIQNNNTKSHLVANFKIGVGGGGPGKCAPGWPTFQLYHCSNQLHFGCVTGDGRGGSRRIAGVKNGSRSHLISDFMAWAQNSLSYLLSIEEKHLS